ncbi:SHOCT domain-containing protein [Natronococcus wangiae]|uniref:SHOCT domain-containing protein n=1 Tax=Natronococcus wangiae TaxID=3068275 RepID=UPI00273EBE21|nr:SHOCT domain-containing protein [Natronococcus sp. AD5]
MIELRDALGRSAGRATVSGAVFLVAATATASAQTHGGGGGPMGGWDGFGGWMFLWPILLLGLLALLVVWAGSRRRGDRTVHIDRSDHGDRTLEQLRERYARGEFSDEEFERRRRNLQSYTND